jgi:NAD(P)H-dependent flavin oxidoreductase YrpB (nitropropane dioxygenase family)
VRYSLIRAGALACGGEAEPVHQVGSVAEAERAAAAGIDVIVAQGVEAGGHVPGEVSTVALIPRVVDAAGPVELRTRNRLAHLANG